MIDGDNVIGGGQTRWQAAQLLELEKVPVVIADDLAAEQIRA